MDSRREKLLVDWGALGRLALSAEADRLLCMLQVVRITWVVRAGMKQ